MVHKHSKKKIAEHLGYNYSTVVNFIQAFESTGRLFKLLPNHSKCFILRHRAESLESQKLYKKYWRKKAW